MTPARAPSATPDRLRQDLRQAFAARAYPGDAAIGINTPNCAWYEGEVVARWFRGRRWEEVRFDDMLADDDSPLGSVPAFMTPAALAYYLPAFLLIALEEDAEPDSDRALQRDTFADSVCHGLTRPAEDMLEQQYEIAKATPGVPADTLESLRNPTPEARKAVRQLIRNHEQLVADLSPAERSAVAGALLYLAARPDPCGPGMPESFAATALRTTWRDYLSDAPAAG